MRRSAFSFISMSTVVVLAVGIGILAPPASATSAATCFVNRTVADGLGESLVWGVLVDSGVVYASTNRGVSISSNGGSSFVNHLVDSGNSNSYAVSVVGSNVYSASYEGINISFNGGQAFTTNNTGIVGGAGGYWADVYALGGSIYAGTNYSGVGISPLRKSTDGGVNWTASSTGLGSATVAWLYGVGNTLYAATDGDGLGISVNSGASFSLKTTADGLGSNHVYGAYSSGSTVYAATVPTSAILDVGGLSISTNGGSTFTNRTTADGLGSNNVNGVYAVGSTVYAATSAGLSISTDDGVTFTNYTTADGLGDNAVNGVFVDGGVIYAATYGGLSISGNCAASGSNVPTAPQQAYGRTIDGTCEKNAPEWVNWQGIASQQFASWGASWAQWPNGGAGGYVCARQPYFTGSGTWSVR